MTEVQIHQTAIAPPPELTGGGRVEIDMQIATARAYPRSAKAALTQAIELVTLNETVAEDCFYALPRGEGEGTVDGPSVRLAEIVAACWGNARYGGRVVDEGPEFITAQGLFFDLEKNVQVSCDVRRRIVNRYGRRYGTDMIGVTGNAAMSIALRNAVLRGIPKAYWWEVYRATRRTAIGDVTTLETRRKECVRHFGLMGVTEDQVLAVVGRRELGEVGLDDLGVLKGLATALKDGDTTIERAFPKVAQPAEEAATGKGVEGLEARIGGER